ncbi:hypothetical protein B1987_01325 [Mycobacterium kansasii]|uniref:IrrE N-terminal-like domain-containing protein n=1 Tax=Mycobacterium attenuatum TaxID=2341086 RepID=A0A498QGD5_9MYCO|nr:hypothetical protein B1987_01325 [Mycobacterium kansasii]VBA44477.1 hypothetical protein LAUMK136_05640 [Mycobacterium attenuatum]
MAVPNAELLALARTLHIPVPWNRDVFIENLASQRGRPIRLLPTDTSAFTEGPCGVWLIRDDDDVILYDAETSDYHIDQIVCHEIGHMMLGHGLAQETGTDRTLNSDAWLKVLPDIDLATVNAVLRRTAYASDQERDAEIFASVLMIAAAEANERSSVMMRSAFFGRQ